MSKAGSGQRGRTAKISVTLYVSPWVPIYEQVKEHVNRVCAQFADAGQVKVAVKVVGSEDPAAESSRIITVPSLVVSGFGYERTLKGRQVVDRLEATLRQIAVRAGH